MAFMTKKIYIVSRGNSECSEEDNIQFESLVRKILYMLFAGIDFDIDGDTVF